MRLERTVLITGATGAVGQAAAQAAARAGARVALTARRDASLAALAGSLGLPTDCTLWQPADLTVAEEAERVANVVAERWGGIEVLWHIAGGWAGGSRLADLDDATWRQMLDLNLQAAFHICRAVLPQMAAAKWGRLVLIASRAAVEPGARQAAYNVAKAGVVALTSSIAADYRRQGIAANALLPAIIDTPANREQMPDADTSRWVPPEALAEMMLALSSETAGHINGAAIPVYGRL